MEPVHTLDPEQIIGVMHHQGMLATEPATTRERITSAVHYMMIKNGIGPETLARALGTASGAHYIQSRKMRGHHWKVDDLDALGELFGLHPAEFAFGYQAIADSEMEDHG